MIEATGTTAATVAIEVTAATEMTATTTENTRAGISTTGTTIVTGITTTNGSSPGALSRTAGMNMSEGRSGPSRLTFAPAAWCWWIAPRGLWLRTTSTIAATGAGIETTSTSTTTTATPAGICSTTPGWGVTPT